MNLLSELTVDAKPNTQFNSFSLLILIFRSLYLFFFSSSSSSFRPPPPFVTYFSFFYLLIFDNSFRHVILQFISSLSSITVKNAALLTICIYCYKGRAVTNVGRTCSPTLL